jgi:TolB protein
LRVSRDVAAARNPCRQRLTRQDLFVVNADGTGLRPLAATPRDESAPSWSPDGRSIVFSRDSTGTGRYGLYVVTVATGNGSRIVFESTSRTNPARPVAEIWVMRSDGSRKQRLTPYNRRRPVESVSPSWSPGGALIVFTRGSQLWTMRPDGSRVRQLTRRPGAAWSADW